MDRRSWPWKKKSSDKSSIEKVLAAADAAGTLAASAGSQGDQGKQDNYKKPNYVQISVESYSHFNRLEVQVKSYEDQVKSLKDEVNELNEKLFAAESEMITKDNLVKQHAKVAEEAVSGWEKAESEAAALKNHLESVTLLKLTAEDRASHLDGALKECMRQIRNLKEEHEQKLHDVVLTKTRQWEKIKLELETKIAKFEQEILKTSAENSAFSKSLQERSNMLIELREEKSEADAQIECLKSNVESCEREINSLKYELHIISKELEIRNEEKNMSLRSAEVANKQHLEGVKKIAKLEAECQRLRGLVKKKLPGPAALAQMKLEVENLGQDYGETRLRKSPLKPSSPHLVPEFSYNIVQKYHKENELLTERLLAMEEETKMLKEGLAKRNTELQASRSICAKTASKLQGLEAEIHANSDRKSQNASNPPSSTSVSDDGNNNDSLSCAGSWTTTAQISELTHLKKEKSIENGNHLELLDDFLEMEKLAILSNESNNVDSSLENSNNERSEVRTDSPSKGIHENWAASEMELSAVNPQSDPAPLQFAELQSRISLVFESLTKEANLEKILDDIKHIVKDVDDCLPRQSLGSVVEETDISHIISHKLAAAVSQIHDFVLFLGKQDTSTDEDGLIRKSVEFSSTFNDAMNCEIDLVNFILHLSNVLAKASELKFNVMGYKNNEPETSTSDCIDKIALPENRVESSTERDPNSGCIHFSDSTSDPDTPHERSFIPSVDSTTTKSWKCSMEEFEQIKLEKEKAMVDLSSCSEDLERTRSQVQETERLLAEVKSELASALKLNGLAETQLKCMAESYKSLEIRADDLQAEVNHMRVKTENLESELEQERKSRQDALARCMVLQEQIQRIESCPVNDDLNANQERELAAASEKLAECQETIFLLEKQFKSLRPQKVESEPNTNDLNSESTDIENLASPDTKRVGGDSLTDLYNSPFCPDSESNTPLRSPISSKHAPKHRPTKSGSSSYSSSAAQTADKHSRGFSRFFSSKGHNIHWNL